VSPAFEREVNPDGWRYAVAYGVTFGFGAAFPRLWSPRRLRSPLHPRAVVAYIALNTALGFALLAWVLPYLRRMAEKREQAEEELRRQLGRTPTEDELLAHLGVGRRTRPAGP
jgi:hypothetical protein